MKDKDLSAMLPTHRCHNTKKTQTGKTKEQLINELTEMRQRIADLESGKIKHKKVERELKNSEEKLRNFIDSSTVGIWCFRVKNPVDITLPEDKMLNKFFKSKCVECNETYAKMMGTIKSEILGIQLSEVMPDNPENREYLKTFIHNGFQISGGISHEIDKNGEEKYFSNSMTATIKNGKLIEAWGTQTDITELKRAEEELKAINKELTMLSQTVKSMKECVSVTNKDHKIIFINKTFLETYGFKENEILGKTINLIFSPSNPKNLKEKIRSSTMKGSWKGELLNVRKDGTEFPIELSTSILKDDKGNTIAYIGISSDITERKQAEETLHKSEERFRSIVENSHDGIIIIDDDYKFLYVNDEFCKILDRPRTEIIGKDFREFLDGESLTLVTDYYIRRQKGEDVPPRYEFNIVRPNGISRRVEISSTIIKDSKGRIKSVAQLLDITERKKAEEALRNSERDYRELFENMMDGLVVHKLIVDKNGKPVDYILEKVNSATERILSWKREDIEGKRATEVYGRDTPFIERYARVAQTGEAEYFIDYYPRFGRWYEITSFCPKIGHFANIFRDITERKRAEIIQKSLYQIATSVHATKSMGELSRIIQLELGKVLDTTNFFIALYNKEEEKISLPYFADEKDHFETFPAGKTCTAYVIKNEKSLLAKQKKLKELIKSGKVEVVGTLSKVWLGVPLKVENEVVGALVVQSYTDENAYNEKDLELLEFVSSQIGLSIEHKRSDEKVQESEEKYRLLVESINDGIVISQRDKFIFFNKQFSEMLGYTYDELFMKDYRDIYTEKSVEILMERKRLRDRGKYVPSRYETVFKKKDGTTIDVEANVTIIEYKGDKATFAVIRNITKRKKSEKAIRDSEANFKSLAQNAFDSIAINNEDGDYVYVNRRSAELTGYSIKELLKLNLKDLTPHSNTEKVLNRSKRRIRIKGKPIDNFFEATLLRKDGVELPIEVTATRTIWQGKPADMVFFRDITERKKLEEEALKSQKLESIGILAGGIAHDFNNILTAIFGNITLAKMYAKPEDKVYDRLVRAEKASMRAKDLTQRLLTFSNGGAPVKEIASVVNLLKESATFALTGSNVICKFAIPHDIRQVEIDRGQISQVINNLVINADQAMPDGGTIVINVENINIGKESTLFLNAGKYVKINIEDQGIGISEKYLNKIFDPYFTTKTKGSGLGLATVFSIIKNHDGLITVDSKLGVGTKFSIYLPASTKKALEEGKREGKPLTGKGRILLMDDDELLREVAGKMIENLGYEIEFAKDGNETISLYKNTLKSSIPFDAVIMDLTIPGGMGGKYAIKKLLKIDPDAKAIVSSGYYNDPIMSEFEKYGFVGVVAKPYKIEELGEALYKVVMESKE
ncbi:MAG: PAS domain S-box protein [Candidatus Marinimicrobia bacterium]|nr:PAS domain S-box protein [Candidatus Neomarinimicrobiota bacterium]